MGIEDWFKNRAQRSRGTPNQGKVDKSLQDVFDEAPSDLESYFQSLNNEPVSRRCLNLLPEQECIKRTEQFRGFHPLVAITNAFYLDDPNTSNHHFYLPDLPLAGSVLYLNHDGDTRIVFRTLDEMLTAARLASTRDCSLDDLHTNEVFLADDQDRLNTAIARLFNSRNQEDNEAALLLFIESSDLSDAEFFETMAADDNYYYGEALARTILARPDERFLSIAEVCQAHRHDQVSRPGGQAVKAIHQLRSER